MCPRVEGVYGHLYYVIIVYQHQDTADETESFIPVFNYWSQISRSLVIDQSLLSFRSKAASIYISLSCLNSKYPYYDS